MYKRQVVYETPTHHVYQEEVPSYHHYEPEYHSHSYHHSEPIVSYTTVDHNMGGYEVHHPELSHKYDDAHDVTPVPFHEHAVLPVTDLPDHHSYRHEADEHWQFPPVHSYDSWEGRVQHDDSESKKDQD